MTVRRSIILLVCAVLLAFAGGGSATAGDFGLAYTRMSEPAPFLGTEGGTVEATYTLEGVLGWSCEVTGEFELRGFIRKRVEIARVGSWRNLRFRNCTNGYTVNEVGSAADFYYEEEILRTLPIVQGIYARFDTFSLLVTGPLGERCQYINDRSERRRRTRVTFRELTSFSAGGTLRFTRDLGGLGPICAAESDMTVSFALTTAVAIPIIGIS
jgi:hypothetical protein